LRRPIIAANWKMNKTTGEAEQFARDLVLHLKNPPELDVVVAPPFTALGTVGPLLQASGVALAAQNVHPEPSGAFTGEVSVPMLVDLGCSYVILGHSERRALFGETSAGVSRKLCAVQGADLRPIVCIGETIEEREAGRTFDVVGTQLEESLQGADPARAAELVIAYEPVWAIGTGKTATPEMAQEVHGFIRERLGELVGESAGEIRIQYGGSVKPENSADLMAQPDIDGALVGGASLDPDSFFAIISFDRAEESGP
jgi:triosephosphate isomerase